MYIYYIHGTKFSSKPLHDIKSHNSLNHLNNLHDYILNKSPE